LQYLNLNKLYRAKICLFALSPILMSLAPVDEEGAAKRVYAHLALRDPETAAWEAKYALETFPTSQKLQFALIRALCEKGDEVEALESWARTSLAFKEIDHNRNMLETLAWGVLNKGDRSSQLFIRLNSLIGASLTNDAKAIPILIGDMRDTNAMLRSLAIRFSCKFGDAPLQKELVRLLKEEKVWYVRLEVIKAIGMQRMTAFKPELKQIIGSSKTLLEEKFAAIFALVSMYDEIDPEELKNLIGSNRAGLRQVACELISHLDLRNEVPALIGFLKDSSPDVRIAALNALGLLRVTRDGDKPLSEALRPLMKDPSPEVAMTANWVGMLLKDPEAELQLKTWMKDSNPKWRRLASAAVAASGEMGIPLAQKEMKESSDPYVQVNLALALIGHRKAMNDACVVIDRVFKSEKDTLWMWDTKGNPLFRSLSPSDLKHIEQVPNYPMVVDQLVRLDLLSVLSVMRYAKAQEMVKTFLQHQSWGVSGAAIATLLEEGDSEALELVRGLLGDPEEKVRVQAALILALFGKDPSAVSVLQAAYPNVDREMKIFILEALGQIGDAKTIPFLIAILKEPYQVLRVVAASALIQCLYH
jgi:HEAT repeat protein